VSQKLKNRVEITNISPAVDCGRHAAKAVVGDQVVVGADILREGHEKLAAAVRFRGPTDRTWREAPLALDVNDRWFGAFPVDRMGAWRYPRAPRHDSEQAGPAGVGGPRSSSLRRVVRDVPPLGRRDGGAQRHVR
jgi:hypothetical protein